LDNSLARAAGVSQRAQFLQRLSVLRSIRDLLRTDDVVERRDKDAQTVDVQFRRVLDEVLVAQELETAPSRDSEQYVDVACRRAPGTDLEAVDRAGVDFDLKRLDRAFTDLQARP
jgi:hypothetical protein